jgi:hypothetical protein
MRQGEGTAFILDPESVFGLRAGNCHFRGHGPAVIAEADRGYSVRQVQEPIDTARPNLTPCFRSRPSQSCGNGLDRADFGEEAGYGVNVVPEIMLKKSFGWLPESS